MKTVWTLLSNEESEGGVTNNRECSLFLTGPIESGKTALTSTILGKELGTKSSFVLDYNYAKTRKFDTLEDWTLHVWEVGSGTELLSPLQPFLSPGRLSSCLVVFVVDLSKPDQIWRSLETTLSLFNSMIDEVIKKNRQLKDQLVQKMRQRVSGAQKDINEIKPFLLPGVIVGNKFDILKTNDTMTSKIVGKTLRYFAHSNGLALLYNNNLSEGVASKTRSQIKSLIFNGKLTTNCEDDLIAISFGGDSFDEIGKPIFREGSTFPSAATPDELWMNAIHSFFPPSEDGGENNFGKNPAENVKYSEKRIDEILSGKTEERIHESNFDKRFMNFH